MDEYALEALRELSRAAFNQTYRLEVMLAIAESDDGIVSLSGLATSLGLPVSNVQGPVRSLVKLGLLRQAPSGDSRTKYLLRAPSAAWAWARELADAAAIDERSTGQARSSAKERSVAW